MHDLFAPQPLAELGAKLARLVRVFLVGLLVAGRIEAAVALGIGFEVDHVAFGWALLACFSIAGVHAYRPPGA